jgi:hypothetical protein
MNPIKKLQAKITGLVLNYRYDQRAKQNTRKVYVNENYSDETVKVVHTAVKIMATLYVVRQIVARVRRMLASVKHQVTLIVIPVKVRVWYRGIVIRYHVLNAVRTIRLIVARLIVAAYIVYLMSALFPVNPEASY